MKNIVLIVTLSLSCLFSQTLKNQKQGEAGQYPQQRIIEQNEQGEILPGIEIDPNNFILDNEIDPDKYLLGPGDQLDLFIGGILQKHIILTVLPDGNILIPEIGIIKISKMSITQAKKEISSKLRGVYNTNEIEVVLIHMRKFRTYISGMIKKPGTYFLQSSDRVSSIIQKAGGFEKWADPSRIQIRNNDSSYTANLWDFFYKGDIDQNPYLNQGDIIFVPSIDLTKPYVVILSTNGSEQYIPLLKNETLKDFLDRNHLITPRSDISNIEFQRKDSTIIVNISDYKSQLFELQKGDKITIPILRGEVYISGQILHPGPYPYIPDYTAWDYIAKAGIMESSADINNVQVIHFATKEIAYGPDTIVENGDIIFLGRKSREDYKDYINILVPVLTLFVTVFLAFGK